MIRPYDRLLARLAVWFGIRTSTMHIFVGVWLALAASLSIILSGGAEFMTFIQFAVLMLMLFLGLVDFMSGMDLAEREREQRLDEKALQ